MECTIPGPSIRPFCAAIGCLSRIGKELYIDFDPIDGLSLRALNDSKSVFGSFHYETAFFTRCSSAALPSAASRKRKATKPSGGREDDGSCDDVNGDERWTVRVAMKALAAVVRPRRDVLSLQVVTLGDHLAFEFQLQRPGGAVVRVTHEVGYATAQGLAAVAATENASELVVQPHVVATMLDPLKRSSEIALLVNERHRLVSSVTFAHDDLPDEATSALSRWHASLKTETSVGYDDLVDVHYVGNADENGSGSDTEGDIPPPDDLKEQVVLVFTLKEFKAFLQYCSQAVIDQELQVSIQFYWGGKPMIVKTTGEHFSAELVMATLDHRLLGTMRTSSTTPDPAAA